MFKRLTAGHNVFINELRRVSVVFVGVRGLNVATERGSQIAHKLMQLTQKAAYTMVSKHSLALTPGEIQTAQLCAGGVC